jgi:hypothetical protein
VCVCVCVRGKEIRKKPEKAKLGGYYYLLSLYYYPLETIPAVFVQRSGGSVSCLDC